MTRAARRELATWAMGGALPFLTAAALAHAQSLSPEYPLTTPTAGLPGPTSAEPALAAMGQGYLAVWSDGRNGLWNVYRSRLAPNLMTLDGTGLPVAPSSAQQGGVAAACTATRCLVTWTEGDYGATRLFGVRLNFDGSIVEAIPTLFSDPTAFCRRASIATDGTDFFVVWMQTVNAVTTVQAARVSAATGLRDPGGVTVVSGVPGSQSSEVDVTFATSEYLLVYTGPDSVQGLKVYGDGGLTSAFPVAPIFCDSGWCDSPRVAWNGSEALVTFIEENSGYLYGSRVAADGGSLDPNAFLIAAFAPQNGWLYDNAVAAGDAGFWTFWTYGDGLYPPPVHGARVGTDGTLLDSPPLPISGSPGGYSPSATCGATGCAVAWEGGAEQVEASALDWGVGAVNSPAIDVPPPQGGANDQANVGLTCGPQMCLAFWPEGGTSGEYRAARILLDGGILDPLGFDITHGGVSSGMHVAAGVSDFMAVWTLSSFGRGSRIDLDGTVANPAGEVLTDAGPYWAPLPTLAFDGQHYWISWPTPVTSVLQVGELVSDGGLHVDSPTVLPTLASVSCCAVASGFSQAIVSWSTWTGTFATRLDPSAGVVDPSGLLVEDGGFPNEGLPQIAAGPDGYDLLWQVTSPPMFRAAHMGFDGGSTIPVSLNDPTPAGALSGFALTHDGINAVVIWSDDRGGTLPSRQLRAAYLVVDGGIAQSELDIPTPTPAFAPAAARLTNGTWLVVFDRFDPTPGVNSMRLFARVVSELPLVDAGTGSDGGSGPDGGSVADGGVALDAGAVPDGGVDAGAELPHEPVEYHTRCGCSAPPVSGLLPAWLLLWALRSRRGRRRSSPCTTCKAPPDRQNYFP